MLHEWNRAPVLVRRSARVLALDAELASVRVAVALIKLAHAVERESKYSPDQLRVPAGQSDGGQLTSEDGGGSGSFSTEGAEDSPSSADGKPVQLALAPGLAAEKAAEAALALYAYWASRNSPESTAALEFRAQEFLRGVAKKDPAIGVRNMTREDVDQACPRHGEVQGITDRAADRVTREGNYWGAAAYGTRVHTAIEKEVNNKFDPNMRAEVSFIKSNEENRGTKNSKRIDVIENVGDGNVCVYDIKTGKSKLSAARMVEIASNVHSFYPGTKKIVVIETRPMTER